MKPNTCPVEGCWRSFDTEDGLAHHRRRIHDDPEMYRRRMDAKDGSVDDD